jgi:hypothetical protein
MKDDTGFLYQCGNLKHVSIISFLIAYRKFDSDCEIEIAITCHTFLTNNFVESRNYQK